MLAGLWLWCVVFPCSPAWVVVCAGESSVWPNWHGSGLGGFLGRDHTVPSCCNALGVVLHPLVECFYVYIALTDSELLLTVARIGTEKKQLFKPYVVATNTFLISKNCLVPWTSALWFWEVGVSVKIFALLQPVCVMIRCIVLFMRIFLPVTTCHTMHSSFMSGHAMCARNYWGVF